MNRAKFEDYEAFVEKFKVKKTTDECWTPPEIYDVVRDWACAEYGIDAAKIVRPFYPGGDYERFDYSGGKVVLDNPPFSILSRILSFYLDRGIPFFLFAPGLTAFSSRKTAVRACRVLVDCDVVYANGAGVDTAFVTSFEPGCAVRTAAELSQRLRAKVAELRGRGKKRVRRYDFPPQLLRAAAMSRLASLGVDFRVSADDCVFVSRLDAMPKGGGVFGGGLLVPDRVAAEYAAAMRAAAMRAARAKSCADVIPLELSERERAIVASLARGKN